MFQNEVRQALGDDFVRQARSGGGRNQVPAGAAGGARKTDPATDTGMMKALASMGSATKQNLMQLAQRFSRNQTSTSGTTRSSGGQMYRNGETGTAREFKPLVDSNDDDEVRIQPHFIYL